MSATNLKLDYVSPDPWTEHLRVSDKRIGEPGGWAMERVFADLDPETTRPLTGAWRMDVFSGQVWWSPEVYVIFGVHPSTFTPTLETIMPQLEADSRERLRDNVARMRREPMPDAATYRLIRPDGEHRLLDSHCWVEREGEGDSRWLVGICQDITELSALHRERRRLSRLQSTILRTVGDGICGLDAAGRITFANPGFASLLQRDADGLVGERLHDLIHRDSSGGEDHSNGECPYTSMSPARSGATDAEVHRADGSRIEVAYVRVVVDEDGWRGTIVSMRDITARRAASRLLQTSLQQVQSLSAQRGALLRHLSEAEERERMRIAADIHDDTIQTLGAVALRLSRAGEQAGSDPDRDLLADSEIQVRAAAEGLRRVMFELLPPLSGADLRSAVETYCAVVFAESSIVPEVTGEVGRFDADTSLVAYRLIQEALRNAAKHSHGTRVRVSFETATAQLIVRISDDGVGMGTPPSAAPPTHAGLRIVRQRAEAAGGSANFGVGLDGRGTSLELRLPVDSGDHR